MLSWPLLLPKEPGPLSWACNVKRKPNTLERLALLPTEMMHIKVWLSSGLERDRRSPPTDEFDKATGYIQDLLYRRLHSPVPRRSRLVRWA